MSEVIDTSKNPSALQLAQREIERLRAELADKDAALEFYASADNWHHKNSESVEYRLINEEDMGVGDFNFNEITDDEWVGGKRAREVLNKYKGEG